MKVSGKSLQLYFIDGNPDGMQTAEVFNWTGHVLMTPRTQISKALKREIASHTGVYILLGDNKDGEPMAYIGEAENMAVRFKDHVQKKDWWTSAVLVSSASDVLNKAHVKFLEARLIETARAVGRMPLDNNNTPARPGLSEADGANMEVFLDYILMVLPALRIDMFIQNAKTKELEQTISDDPTSSGARFTLTSKKHNLKATARLVDGEFIVEAGSQARDAWHSPAKGATYEVLRKELETNGTLVHEGGKCVFTQDYAFKSPSAAAAVVQGRPANGTVEWFIAGTSQTYKVWEQSQLPISLNEDETF